MTENKINTTDTSALGSDGYPLARTRFGRWLTAHQGPVCAATMAVSLAVVFTVAWTSPSDDTDNGSPVPPDVTVCTTATGEGQTPCWHHDRESGWILNLDNGRTFYVIDTQDVITR